MYFWNQACPPIHGTPICFTSNQSHHCKSHEVIITFLSPKWDFQVLDTSTLDEHDMGTTPFCSKMYTFHPFPTLLIATTHLNTLASDILWKIVGYLQLTGENHNRLNCITHWSWRMSFYFSWEIHHPHSKMFQNVSSNIQSLSKTQPGSSIIAH